ncbi:hypothetical protein [Paenibacillus sp. TAF43_2]|uniref:hypothetical protein n=1 Tax=Paenibacillus sp. TAF43_2 TaxID=3233069 RepID=UPI003F96CC1D
MFLNEVFLLDMSKATLKELVIIRHFDEAAKLQDKIDAETEFFRRQRKRRSSKLDKHPGSKR